MISATEHSDRVSQNQNVPIYMLLPGSCFSPAFTCESFRHLDVRIKRKKPNNTPLSRYIGSEMVVFDLRHFTCSSVVDKRSRVSSQSPLRTGFAIRSLAVVDPVVVFFSVRALIVQICRFLTCAVVIIVDFSSVLLLMSKLSRGVFVSIRFQLVWHHPVSHYHQVKREELVSHRRQRASTVESQAVVLIY